ncbi:MAG: hypothetical protein GY765_36890 [bacterium]|nr:hypothetical protein [bacterium]
MTVNNQNKTEKMVTNLGRVFIAFSAYSTGVSLLQGLLFLSKSPMQILLELLPSKELLEYLPRIMISYLQDHYLLITWTSFFLSAVTLGVAFAFFKRHNWARVFFAVFMLLTIVVVIRGIFFYEAFIPNYPGIAEGSPALETIKQVILTAFIFGGTAISILHAWLGYILLSPKVKAVFQDRR